MIFAVESEAARYGRVNNNAEVGRRPSRKRGEDFAELRSTERG